jgi:hypothetical protein
MIRKTIVAVTAAGLALGGLVFIASPAGAAKPTITATGSATCQITGKLKIAPPLTNTNTSVNTTTGKLKGTCTGSTEQGVTPNKVKATLTSTTADPGTCTSLVDPAPHTDPFVVHLSWKASGGKINPSNVTFPGYAVEGVNFALHNGTSVGSYAGTGTAEAIGIPDVAKLADSLATCNPTVKPNGKVKPPKGVKKITIVSGTLTLS